MYVFIILQKGTSNFYKSFLTDQFDASYVLNKCKGAAWHGQWTFFQLS